MKVEIDKLKKREEYINCQKHPSLDLLIWNYNHSCQFDGAWDDYTIIARGLITDSDGNIIARPFKKFFNLEEREETKMCNLPVKLPEITEKYDGSLGIQYYNGDMVCIATRGSFNGEQALWATEWMKRFKRSDFKEGYTYLYEIIYPENRIVVNYGDRRELVLLAVKNIETGEELDFKEEAKRLGINCPKVVNENLNDLLDYISKMSADEEGFVMNYGNDFRIKIKGQEYLRLHRLITGFSTKSLWECLMENSDLSEVLERVPDEFYSWVKEKEKELRDKFDENKKEAVAGYKKVKDLPDRKSQALEIMKNYKKVSSIIFSLLDEKEIDKLIWRGLRPKYELPFKKEV